MAKCKARHNPNKKANMIGKWCQYAEWDKDNNLRPYGECGFKTDKCKGLAHNCVKSKYRCEQIKRSE